MKAPTGFEGGGLLHAVGGSYARPMDTPEPPALAAGGSVEAWLDGLDPGATPARNGRYLRAVAEAQDAADAADQRLRDAVAEARAAGESWASISVALGTSGLTARRQFGRGPHVTGDVDVALPDDELSAWEGAGDGGRERPVARGHHPGA